mgnify:CR=1 FL=1
MRIMRWGEKKKRVKKKKNLFLVNEKKGWEE